MTLVRWSRPTINMPRDLVTMRDEMDRLFDRFFEFGGLRGDVAGVFTPAVDIEETTEDYVLRADLPGMSEKDVRVSLVGDTLTVRGERRQEHKDSESALHRYERLHGLFERSFRLPSPLKGDQVKAKFKDGVLEIRVPKAEEARSREIEIQVG